MAAGCWALGYVAARFWNDWSVPAPLSLAAVELEDVLEGLRERRLALGASVAAAALVLLGVGADSGMRWSQQRSARLFLSRANPSHAPWLPEPGGVAYSADLGVFYSIFFRNPDAPWKFVLGFEPALMRPEDYSVFVAVRRSHAATESFLPWVRRMRPEDRLYVQSHSPVPPPVPGLEWFQPVFTIWAGRLPRPAPSPAAPTAP
jgi:hypothetical protein